MNDSVNKEGLVMFKGHDWKMLLHGSGLGAQEIQKERAYDDSYATTSPCLKQEGSDMWFLHQSGLSLLKWFKTSLILIKLNYLTSNAQNNINLVPISITPPFSCLSQYSIKMYDTVGLWLSSIRNGDS